MLVVYFLPLTLTFYKDNGRKVVILIALLMHTLFKQQQIHLHSIYFRTIPKAYMFPQKFMSPCSFGRNFLSLTIVSIQFKSHIHTHTNQQQGKQSHWHLLLCNEHHIHWV